MFETNYGTPMMQGYNYNGMQPNMVKFNNTLTADQIKRLQAKGSQFSLGLTEEETLRARCNHRSADGTQDTLVYDPLTDQAVCQICGYKFRPVEPDTSIETIKNGVDNIVDFLQTIKLMYVDFPAEAAIEYFNIIPLIEKIPQLFEFAAKNMAKHDIYSWQYNNRNMGTVAMFQNLTNMFGGMNAGMYQQPQMANPAFNNGMPGFPNAAYTTQPNAFGYAGASAGYMPGTNPNFAYAPTQQPTTVAPSVAQPTQPAADTTTVSDTVKI